MIVECIRLVYLKQLILCEQEVLCKHGAQYTQAGCEQMALYE